MRERKLTRLPDMLPCKITRDEIEVDARIADFGVTRSELLKIVHAVVTAHNDAVPYDPKSAAGQFRYIYGTRATRDTFCPKKWKPDSAGNIEAVYDPATDRKIVYQSVDCASDERNEPKAISGKGPGAARVVSRSTQAFLFPDMEAEASESRRRENAVTWFFCVSVNGEDVRAELSLPRSVDDDMENFRGFIERIFIVGPGDWDTGGIHGLDDGPSGDDEIEPVVTKK
jgi:hypothetical protein